MRSGVWDKLNQRLRIPPGFQGKGLASLINRSREIEFAKQSICAGRGIFNTGPCGTGKTHLATGILLDTITDAVKRWISNGRATLQPLGLFLSTQEFLEQIRGDFGNGRNSARSEYLAKYTSIDLLLIDDLAAGVFHDWQREILGLLIDRRCRQNKQTLITSNFDLDMIASIIDDRTASRIAEMCSVIRFDGQDFRVNPQPAEISDSN